MKYEERVHSKQFRAVARVLADPQTPVEFVLHVKSPSMLPVLAQKLELLLSAEEGAPTTNVLQLLAPLLHEKTLLLSASEKRSHPFSAFAIPASSIRSSTWCKVIYLPPFYLVHTPGLFEGIWPGHSLSEENRPVAQNPSAPRFKM